MLRSTPGRSTSCCTARNSEGTSCCSAPTRTRRRSSGSCCTSANEHAVEGWDPEDHPRSVLSGRTNDQVKADPDRVWTREGGAETKPVVARHDPPTPDELDVLDVLGAKGTWHFQGRELALTNLDKVLFPARGRAPARHEARAHPLLRDGRAGAAPVPRGAAVEPQPVSRRRRSQGLLAEERTEVHAQMDPPVAQRRRRPRRSRGVPRRRQPARARLARQPRGSRAARVDVTRSERRAADVRARRHRPRRVDDLGRDADARPAAPHRARPSRRARVSEDLRPTRPADLDPDRGRSDVPRDAGVGGAAVADDRRGRRRPRERRMGEEGAGRPGSPRLHAERAQQDARRAVQRAGGGGCARLATDRVGRARRPQVALRSLDGTRRRGATRRRGRPHGPDAHRTPRCCPRSNDGRGRFDRPGRGTRATSGSWVRLEFEPRVSSRAPATCLVSCARRTHDDLERFQDFTESRERETEKWRGSVAQDPIR